MTGDMTRREFVGSAALGVAAASVPGLQLGPAMNPIPRSVDDPPFRISLAEWSLHRALQRGDITNLDFPRIAREEFDINGIEYVNSFFKDKARDDAYLRDLKKRCEDHGVTSVLIMCDGEGALGDADETKRMKAVENHYRWVEAAKFLGCHSIRVNASSSGSYQEQQKRAADGLRRLCDFGETHAINVIVENHGGWSSHGRWLAEVMQMVDHPRCGTLPDFGNFRVRGEHDLWYDRYLGTWELMPYAKAVSAKSHDFDDQGNETRTDFVKMMKIVLEAGYRGFVGIEYEGSRLDEYEGIRATKRLLERVRGA